MTAVTQIRHRHSQGRACYDKKLTEGKTPKEALRALKRQISDAIFTRLRAGARRAAGAGDPGGQTGTALSQRGRRLTPRTPALRASHSRAVSPPATAAAAPGRAGHSPIAATLPPAQPGVRVERPQRSEDERPGGAARRQPYPVDDESASEPADVPRETAGLASWLARQQGRTGEAGLRELVASFLADDIREQPGEDGDFEDDDLDDADFFVEIKVSRFLKPAGPSHCVTIASQRRLRA